MKMTWSGVWIAAKTTIAALLGALVPIITQQGLPTTAMGWIGDLAAAGAAAGLYHMPSPTVQPGAQSKITG